ncbi:MAG: hypothetical protein M3432_05840 [Chloroflexota bacterium]|nr:hypothetical protein [Chloroflexota bacterium]
MRLSSLTRLLLAIAAVAFVIFGLVAFVVPQWASENFPWRVGPFLAQTIGGWSLGTAGFAVLAARDGRLRLIYPLLVYLAVFGAGQTLVALAFLDRLQVGLVLTWPGTGGVVLFVIFVLGLAVGTFLAGPDGVVAQGRFFPEQMSLFSIRAFSAFFLAIALSAASALASRAIRPYLELARAGMLLLIPITIASLLNLRLFDFAGRPGGLLYFAAYVVAGVVFSAILWQKRTQAA